VITVSIIGTGNVAFHLAKAFSKAQMIHMQFVAGRSREKLVAFQSFANTTMQLSALGQSDIILIAVSDDSIAQVAAEIPETNALIVHTSGSTSLEVLEPRERIGAFYPLQTFSKNKELNYKKIPFLIEVKIEEDLQLLSKLTHALQAEHFRMNSKERAAYHLAAVFSNNFTNHILTESETLCEQHRISFQLLKPLLEETIEKAFEKGPENSQTGPAKRNDSKTIEKQLAALQTTEQKDLYTTLTKAIQKHYER